jgi:PAS domain S-box-containing protein
MSDLLRLLSNTGDAACAIDPAQRIVLWNDAAEVLFGYAARDVLGRPCAQVIRASDRHGCAVCGVECLASRLAQAGQAITTRDLRVQAKSGAPVIVSATTIVFPERWRRTAILAHLFREISGVAFNGAAAPPAAGASHPTDGAPAPAAALGQLTPREREVLSLLATGAGTNEIAKRLFISPVTVRNHIRRVLEKLGTHSRLEAVTRAMRAGLA